MSLIDLKKKIEKKYGEGTAIEAWKIREKPRFLVPVSPSLDIGLAGGIPTGSWVLISGPPKIGKSVTSMQIAKNAQQTYGAKVFLLNIEGRFKGQSIGAVEGIDLDNFLVIETTQDAILTGEAYLSIAEEILKTEEKVVLIMDSISRLCTEKSMDDEVSGTKRPTTQKLMSDFCSRMSGVVPAKNAIIISIAQVYTNTSGYGAGYIISGGNSIRFQADVGLHAKKETDWTDKIDGEDKLVGKIVEWDIWSNSIGAPATGLTTSYVRFGKGLDRIRELVSLGVDFGLIEKKASWYQYADKKIQGERAVAELLIEDPSLADELEKQIRFLAIDTEKLKCYENMKDPA